MTWLEGTARTVPTEAFDVATMTAHVAQILVDDDDCRATLRHLCRALVAGGRLSSTPAIRVPGSGSAGTHASLARP